MILEDIMRWLKNYGWWCHHCKEVNYGTNCKKCDRPKPKE